MNKRLKKMISILKELFSNEIIMKTARKTKFIKRESKITPEAFLSLCLFWGEDLCTSSLVQLKTRLLAKEGISVTPQGLDKRFNKEAVDFLKTIFKDMMRKSNKILKKDDNLLKSYFKAIKVADSTIINLPGNLRDNYCGSGGSSCESSAKIQLEYDVFSGSFQRCEVLDGISSDADYIHQLEKGITEGELYLKDLGFFKTEHLKVIDEEKAYYISKLKRNLTIYSEDDSQELRSEGASKSAIRYKKIDINELAAPLAEGETIELVDIYIGSKNKIKTRLIITKLTRECKESREKKYLRDVKKGKKKLDEKHGLWNSINIYITNVPSDVLSKEQVHDMYSLRWQIEIMFKIWKSIFKLQQVKKVKLERFECFLYGRLIALMLSSSIVFIAKNIIYEEEKRETSEFKSFCIVKEFFGPLREKIFYGEVGLVRFFSQVLKSILRDGIKCKKKGEKTPYIIVNDTKIKESELEALAI